MLLRQMRLWRCVPRDNTQSMAQQYLCVFFEAICSPAPLGRSKKRIRTASCELEVPLFMKHQIHMCLSAGACNAVRQSFMVKKLGRTARSVLVRSVFATCHFAVFINTYQAKSAQSLYSVAQYKLLCCAAAGELWPFRCDHQSTGSAWHYCLVPHSEACL